MCVGGIRTLCRAWTFSDQPGSTVCTACTLLSACDSNEFRAQCGFDSKGQCTKCKITSDDDCEEGRHTGCDGTTLEDDSKCNNCDCPTNDGNLYWKKFVEGQVCPDCMVCPYTEKNCNDGRYLIDPCNEQWSTQKNSSCAECNAACGDGQYYNSECGGNTPPVCNNCRMQCDDAHPITGMYIDPKTTCDGTSDVDTTVCKRCSDIDVPPGHMLVNCQQKGALRFKKWQKCDVGTFEVEAPTRTSDRKCAPCTQCKFQESMRFVPAMQREILCMAPSQPEPNEFVIQPATRKRDTRMYPYTDCTKHGKWQDMTVPRRSGNSTTRGKDSTCMEYTPCDEESYVIKEKTDTSDFGCAALTVCADLAKDLEKPTFAVVAGNRTTDRVCIPCEKYKGNEDNRYIGMINWDRQVANEEYKRHCTRAEFLTLGGIAGISSAAVVAVIAFGVAFKQLKKKKEAIAEKNMVELELDAAKDDLELVVSMVPNPLAKPMHETKARGALWQTRRLCDPGRGTEIKDEHAEEEPLSRT